MATSREIHLAARPYGVPQPTDFALVEVEVPEPADGEVLIRNAYMSVDPSMRPRMNDVKSYLPPFQVGEVDERWRRGPGRRVAQRARARGIVGHELARLARVSRCRTAAA